MEVLGPVALALDVVKALLKVALVLKALVLKALVVLVLVALALEMDKILLKVVLVQ